MHIFIENIAVNNIHIIYHIRNNKWNSNNRDVQRVYLSTFRIRGTTL